MNAIQKLFGIGFGTAALLGIMALTLFLTGCGSHLEGVKPLIQIEPNCNTWTICTGPTRTTYNVSGIDCITELNPGQAQQLFDIFIAKNVKVGMFKCTEQKQVINAVTVKQVN